MVMTGGLTRKYSAQVAGAGIDLPALLPPDNPTANGYIQWNGSAWQLRTISGAGHDGVDGDNGWSPVLSVRSDSERRVLYLESYTGGEGTAPAITNRFVGASGLVATAAEAVDIRGAQGERGEKGQDGTGGGATLSEDSIQPSYLIADTYAQKDAMRDRIGALADTGRHHTVQHIGSVTPTQGSGDDAAALVLTFTVVIDSASYASSLYVSTTTGGVRWDITDASHAVTAGNLADAVLIITTSEGVNHELSLNQRLTFSQPSGLTVVAWQNQLDRATWLSLGSAVTLSWDIQGASVILPSDATNHQLARFNDTTGLWEAYTPVAPDIPQPSDGNPLPSGAAASGDEDDYSRADHVHPRINNPSAGQVPFASATITVAQIFGTIYGAKDNADSEGAHGTISPNTFEHRGVTYTIHQVEQVHDASGFGNLDVVISPNIRSASDYNDLTLNVNGHGFRLRDGGTGTDPDINGRNNSYFLYGGQPNTVIPNSGTIQLEFERPVEDVIDNLTAADIAVDASGFDGNLSSADVNAQRALDTIDGLVLGGAGVDSVDQFPANPADKDRVILLREQTIYATTSIAQSQDTATDYAYRPRSGQPAFPTNYMSEIRAYKGGVANFANQVAIVSAGVWRASQVQLNGVWYPVVYPQPTSFQHVGVIQGLSTAQFRALSTNIDFTAQFFQSTNHATTAYAYGFTVYAPAHYTYESAQSAWVLEPRQPALWSVLGNTDTIPAAKLPATAHTTLHEGIASELGFNQSNSRTSVLTTQLDFDDAINTEGVANFGFRFRVAGTPANARLRAGTTDISDESLFTVIRASTPYANNATNGDLIAQVVVENPANGNALATWNYYAARNAANQLIVYGVGSTFGGGASISVQCYLDIWVSRQDRAGSVVPNPPSSGERVLESNDGVITWEAPSASGGVSPEILRDFSVTGTATNAVRIGNRLNELAAGAGDFTRALTSADDAKELTFDIAIADNTTSAIPHLAHLRLYVNAGEWRALANHANSGGESSPLGDYAREFDSFSITGAALVAQSVSTGANSVRGGSAVNLFFTKGANGRIAISCFAFSGSNRFFYVRSLKVTLR